MKDEFSSGNLSKTELYNLVKLGVINEVKKEITEWEKNRLTVIGVFVTILSSFGLFLLIPQSVNSSIDTLVKERISPLEEEVRLTIIKANVEAGKTTYLVNELKRRIDESIEHLNSKSETFLISLNEELNKAREEISTQLTKIKETSKSTANQLNDSIINANTKSDDMLKKLEQELEQARLDISNQLLKVNKIANNTDEELNRIQELSNTISNTIKKYEEDITKSKLAIQKEISGLTLSMTKIEKETSASDRILSGLLAEVEHGNIDEKIIAVTAIGQRGVKYSPALPKLKNLFSGISIDDVNSKEDNLATATAKSIAQIGQEDSIEFLTGFALNENNSFNHKSSALDALKYIGIVTVDGMKKIETAYLSMDTFLLHCEIISGLNRMSTDFSSSNKNIINIAINIAREGLKDDNCIIYSAFFIKNKLYKNGEELLPDIQAALAVEDSETVKEVLNESIVAINNYRKQGGSL
ncbi:coiled-coil domain-containing protein 22 (plasmid) [Parasalinivibrio latis]|uniref:hypothetical protein n=1 Tax=Parasalinivibrio latis TaxID=2952610 RepID=UPI0030E3F263